MVSGHKSGDHQHDIDHAQKLLAVDTLEDALADQIGQQHGGNQQKDKVQRLPLIGASQQILQRDDAGGGGADGELGGADFLFLMQIEQDINVKDGAAAGKGSLHDAAQKGNAEQQRIFPGTVSGLPVAVHGPEALSSDENHQQR